MILYEIASKMSTFRLISNTKFDSLSKTISCHCIIHLSVSISFNFFQFPSISFELLQVASSCFNFLQLLVLYWFSFHVNLSRSKIFQYRQVWDWIIPKFSFSILWFHQNID
jgi:hypothetical protein